MTKEVVELNNAGGRSSSCLDAIVAILEGNEKKEATNAVAGLVESRAAEDSEKSKDACNEVGEEDGTIGVIGENQTTHRVENEKNQM